MIHRAQGRAPVRTAWEIAEAERKAREARLVEKVRALLITDERLAAGVAAMRPAASDTDALRQALRAMGFEVR